MNLQLKGKTTLVTGGSRGIGFAAARALGAEGARLAIVGREQANLAKATADLAETGIGDIAAICADLNDPSAANRVVHEALQALGSIDILVNSAGNAEGGPFCDLSDEQWRLSLELKFHAAVRMMRAVIPVMRGVGYGRIINVVGSAGRQPEARFLPVAAANAALLVVTKGLADELGEDGIVITALNPGPTRTDRFRRRIARQAAESGRSEAEVAAKIEAEISGRTPLRRVGEADDIATWITFLASDKAAHFTGQSITVDGGMSRVPD